MHSGRSAYYGNNFLGAFGCATDKAVFLGNAHSKLSDSCVRILKVPAINLTVNSSNLLGIFTAANSKGMLFPGFVSKDEMAIPEGLGLKTAALEGRLSALGNNIATNDKIALVNPDFTKEDSDSIADCLEVEVIRRPIMSFKTVGSACVLTNKGFIIHNSAGKELEELEGLLGLKGGIGTSNMGVPYVGMCILANSNGYLAGMDTGGFEMHRVDEALGFLER